MNETNDVLSPNRIRELANSFQVSRIILTAVELNIFTVLDKHLLPSEEVAHAIDADIRATDRLMNSLVAIGFLKKKRGKFYNSEEASLYLVKGKPEYMGGLLHSNEMWKSWGTLTECVKEGTAVFKKEQSSNEWTKYFIAAMHYRAVKEAKFVVLMLNLTNVKRVLDIGGGSGAFSMAFVDSNKNLESVIFDLPSVISLAKNYVEECANKNRIQFLEGDYNNDDFATEYDMIFLSAIVHINSYDENRELIKKCSQALSSGGQIIIKDWIMNEDRIEPKGGAMFALNMLVGTQRGDTFTLNEMTEWFNSAGITNVEKKDSSFGWSLLIGRKD